ELDPNNPRLAEALTGVEAPAPPPAADLHARIGPEDPVDPDMEWRWRNGGTWKPSTPWSAPMFTPAAPDPAPAGDAPAWRVPDDPSPAARLLETADVQA